MTAGGVGPALDRPVGVDDRVVERRQHGGAGAQRHADLAPREPERERDSHRLARAGGHQRSASEPEHLEHRGIEPVGRLVGVEDLGQPLRPRLDQALTRQQLDRLGQPALGHR